LKNGQPPAGVEGQDWSELHDRFASHLEQFGHIIFQMDFAESLPLDHPEPMLENIKMYLRGEGVNPHQRQQASQAKRIQTAQVVLERLKGIRRWAFKLALKAGQSMAEVREDALADIGLGYPVLRAMLRELGRRLVQVGIIEQADDIFWLEKEEIAAMVTAGGGSLAERVTGRKAAWLKFKAATPPSMLPLKERYMGFKTDGFLAQATGENTGGTLKGVATSPGVVTAPARVLHGPEDFDQMLPGEVLVAGTTTPAWTPLFAMASAVVTDIGGPLSHGSIVAREYGIPAVMGTGVATRRIQSGQVITVDGDSGVVTLSGEA
jgi:phosphohistidine swiveling domain-containing protein